LIHFRFTSLPLWFEIQKSKIEKWKRKKNNKAWRRRMKMSGRLGREKERERERWLVSHVQIPFFFSFFICLIQLINMWLFYLFFNSKITHMASCMRWPSQNWSFAKGGKHGRCLLPFFLKGGQNRNTLKLIGSKVCLSLEFLRYELSKKFLSLYVLLILTE